MREKLWLLYGEGGCHGDKSLGVKVFDKRTKYSGLVNEWSSVLEIIKQDNSVLRLVVTVARPTLSY